MTDNRALHNQIVQSLNDNHNAMADSIDYQAKYEDLLARVNNELSRQQNAKQENAKEVNCGSTEVLCQLKTEALTAVDGMRSLQERWSFIDSTLQDCLFRLNKMEQYMKLNSLLFHGFPKIPKGMHGRELREFIVEQINKLLPNLQGGPVSVHEIEYGHTLNTKRRSSKHIAIVKFSCRFTRNEFFYSKKFLPKSAGVSISEHLTADNLYLLNKAKNIVGEKNVWTTQTRIFAKLHANDENKLPIISMKSLDKLEQLALNNARRGGNSRSPYYVDRGPPPPDGHHHVINHGTPQSLRKVMVPFLIITL